MTGSLQDLLEKQAVIEVLNRLFIATDDRDWPAARACFAPEVLFDMTSLSGGEVVTLTPEQITTTWENGLRPLTAVHHQAGNYLVTIRGSTADAFCYGIALHYRPNPSGRNTRTFVGSYTFHLVQSRGRWVVDRFTFSLKYADGNLDLERS